MTITVDALLPLSFLEAVRNVDLPDDDLDAELVPELRNKRLGLSDTVYAQIRRYSEAARRHQRAVQDEATGIAKLIGRRPDAEEVFRAAGRFLAAQAYQAIPGTSRKLIAVLPSFVARPKGAAKTRAQDDKQEGGFGQSVKDAVFGTSRRQGMVETMAKQTARTVGSQIGRKILRGVLGGIFGGR